MFLMKFYTSSEFLYLYSFIYNYYLFKKKGILGIKILLAITLI